MSNHFILVLAEKSLKPIKKQIIELEGFYNQIGYAFPFYRKKEIETLFKEFNFGVRIIEQPLMGHSFESYRQSHKVDFFRIALEKKRTEISILQSNFEVSSFLEKDIENDENLTDDHKKLILKLLHEEEELKEQLAWSEAIEQTLVSTNKRVQIRFISDLPQNYLEVDAPAKKRLLYWANSAGVKHTFLPKEIVAMLVGAGGVGKTHLGAQLALCVASGVPFLGKIEVESPGAVCMILGENKMEDIHRLLRKNAKNLQRILDENQKQPEYKQFGLFDPHPLKRAAERISILSVHGVNSHFIRNGQPTTYYHNLFQELKEKQPTDGWALILLDPISRFAGVDAEKDNAAATDFIALLERLSDELVGNPTVLISHHKPKPSVSNKESDQTAARGASGLTDGVRWQANLDRQDDKSVAFRIVKSNFTEIPPDFRIKKLDDGTMVYENLIITSDRDEKLKKGNDPNSVNEIMKKFGVHGVI